ncbi:MAG TPA: helix-turn-helix domain-containing protein [Rugosimonospora sp.]|nr:helix-turn-helix domain-containing protein [Rugosimonospora sp.]
MTVEPQGRLRADARRNRDQIMAAAKAVFVESGFHVPMEEIARRAGVGVGTLYRRFPDREALVRDVAEESLRALLAEARAAATEEPAPWDALVRLMRSRDLRLSVRLVMLSARLWHAIRDDPGSRRFRAEIMAVLDGLVRGAQAAGAMRADVGAGDVVALVSLLLRQVPTGFDEVSEVVLERALVLMLDGLRADPGSPLPGRPVTTDDLDQLSRSAPS